MTPIVFFHVRCSHIFRYLEALRYFASALQKDSQQKNESLKRMSWLLNATYITLKVE